MNSQIYLELLLEFYEHFDAKLAVPTKIELMTALYNMSLLNFEMIKEHLPRLLMIFCDHLAAISSKSTSYAIHLALSFCLTCTDYELKADLIKAVPDIVEKLETIQR